MLWHHQTFIRHGKRQRPQHSPSQRPNHPQKHLHEPAQSSQQNFYRDNCAGSRPSKIRLKGEITPKNWQFCAIKQQKSKIRPEKFSAIAQF
jgi:hypothetical protein